MRTAASICCVVLLLGCGGVGNTSKKTSSADTALLDFVDNTSSYKGKSVTLDLEVDDPQEGTWWLIGKHNQTLYPIVVSVPKELKKPNAGPGEKVRVTFLCKNGVMNGGNIATKIDRR